MALFALGAFATSRNISIFAAPLALRPGRIRFIRRPSLGH